MSWLPTLIDACYFLAALLFILGLKRMSSPRTARGGIVWAGVGMLLAVLATFALPGMHHRGLILAAVVIGVAAAWWTGRRVAMTAMPQMVALYNGMGGGAAAAIGAVELLGFAAAAHVSFAVSAHAGGGVGIGDSFSYRQLPDAAPLWLALVGALIGAVSFSGSMVAFAKLQGWMDRRFVFPGQRLLNLAVLALALACLVAIGNGLLLPWLIAAFFVLALLFGLMMTLPIGGADMPVVISLYNAFTGLAVAFEGFVLGNEAMIIAGMVVGAAGTLLTQLMARAMNRSIGNVLFGSFGAVAGGAAQAIEGAQKPIEASDAAVMMAYAERVVIVPGYGMAVAQAQHALREMADKLKAEGVEVKYAIHPVAGRMPGHMNVLLAEANVPYDEVFELEDINSEFAQADVAYVIGANDVTNPAARDDKSSPIYGMPILEVDKARTCLFVKRSLGSGYAGIDNTLFYKDGTMMLLGDAKKMTEDIVKALAE